MGMTEPTLISLTKQADSEGAAYFMDVAIAGTTAEG